MRKLTLRADPAKLGPMAAESKTRPGRGASLSIRLLLLAVLFFMLTEVLILVPSVANFRRDYLRMLLSDAHLAALALEATPDNMISPSLANELLGHVGAYGIVLHRQSKTALVLDSAMPPAVDAVYDLRGVMMPTLVADAAATLFERKPVIARVLDVSPKDPGVVVEAILDDGTVRAAMLAYGRRVLVTSLITSLTTSLLLYFSLRWLVVSRLRRLTQSMIAFRDDPEDAAHIISPSSRRDEIGVAQRELARMQETVRGALRQHERLAALGTAVNKISHDLKSMLSVVRLLSDRLASSDVTDLKRVLPNLTAAIDRAVALCTATLGYTGEGMAPLHLEEFRLKALVAELTPIIENARGAEPPRLVNQVPDALAIKADRDQLFRVLLNLSRNAIEAGARRIVVSAENGGDGLTVTVEDDGHGLPPRARENLFRPFAGSARPGGMGLGLAIAREIARAHGGDIVLGHSGAEGTAFRLHLPV